MIHYITSKHVQVTKCNLIIKYVNIFKNPSSSVEMKLYKESFRFLPARVSASNFVLPERE